jgi:hydroxyacylglutathione hydrolase/adenylyltransferase/sulfurtransferase
MTEEIEVSPERAAELIRDGGVQLVDVREPHEVEAGRLEGSRHVAMGELTGAAGSLDRETPVLFYCLSGARSGMAAQAFRQAGYDARNLSGGLLAWEAAGLPVDGEVLGH